MGCVGVRLYIGLLQALQNHSEALLRAVYPQSRNYLLKETGHKLHTFRVDSFKQKIIRQNNKLSDCYNVNEAQVHVISLDTRKTCKYFSPKPAKIIISSTETLQSKKVKPPLAQQKQQLLLLELKEFKDEKKREALIMQPANKAASHMCETQ